MVSRAQVFNCVTTAAVRRLTPSKTQRTLRDGTQEGGKSQAHFGLHGPLSGLESPCSTLQSMSEPYPRDRKIVYVCVMPEQPLTAIQAIQTILAPALGISAVGMLLLGLLNRYSGLISRVRLLNDEKRKLTKRLTEEENLPYDDNMRYMSIRKQTDELVVRSRLIRNALLALVAAVGMFVAASILIGLSLFVDSIAFRSLPLVLFMAGMLCVLAGVIYAGIEVHRSFTIVLLEVKAEE